VNIPDIYIVSIDDDDYPPTVFSAKELADALATYSFDGYVGKPRVDRWECDALSGQWDRSE
jgi:hypothetical protein